MTTKGTCDDGIEVEGVTGSTSREWLCHGCQRMSGRSRSNCDGPAANLSAATHFSTLMRLTWAAITVHIVRGHQWRSAFHLERALFIRCLLTPKSNAQRLMFMPTRCATAVAALPES